MVLESRNEKGEPVYNIVCTSCGVLLSEEKGRVAMALAQRAVDSGWLMGDGWLCGECTTGPWLGPEIDLTPPPGYSAPARMCQCGTMTKRTVGKCRNCKKELGNE